MASTTVVDSHPSCHRVSDMSLVWQDELRSIKFTDPSMSGQTRSADKPPRPVFAGLVGIPISASQIHGYLSSVKNVTLTITPNSITNKKFQRS